MPNEHINKVVLGDEVLLDLTSDTATAADVAAGKTLHLATGARAVGNATYAGSPTVGGNANASNAILYGAVDSTSTSTAFTATVDGLDALVDGTTVMLRNAVVTSAAGFTINVNSLGAKPVYNSLATGNPITPTAPTQDSTIFNINYTMMFVFVESDIVAGGCWLCFRGYDSNTNTIGYQLRTNSGNMVASDTGYRYRLWLTQADGKKWVPINTSTSTNATSNRTLNTRKIDPFGRIVYRSTNGTCSAGAGIGATAIWDQYTLTIGYSYMASGFSLTAQQPVYLRCAPQTDGSAQMEVITQTLPSSNDGKIYIHLGTAYSATNMELEPHHPVYWHDGTGVRIWTGAEPSSGGGSKTTWYGTCNTALNNTYTVTCDGYTLQTGAIISILFSTAGHNGSSNNAVMLNVNGTGDKIVYVGNSQVNNTTNTLFWTASSVLTFMYDGTYYRFLSMQVAANVTGRGAETWYGVCSDNATTSAKTANVFNFTLKAGAFIVLKCSTANTYVSGALTLNIFSTGAKTIYKNGAATSSTNTLLWNANDILTFCFDGSYWCYVGGSSTEGGYTLPPATSSTLGGVKVGSGLSVAADGTLSLDVASASGVSF